MDDISVSKTTERSKIVAHILDLIKLSIFVIIIIFGTLFIFALDLDDKAAQKYGLTDQYNGLKCEVTFGDWKMRECNLFYECIDKKKYGCASNCVREFYCER